MAYKALVSIAGQDLPEPSIYNANTSTLIDTARNVEGRMIGSIIRDNIAEVELGWSFLTVKQWADINKLFKESTGGSFVNIVTFFDQTSGEWTSREMYVSDRSAPMWRRDSDTGDILGWVECALTLSEV
ncbi:MAG: hypothetical protein RSF82_12100 [Angelakisella sp.]